MRVSRYNWVALPTAWIQDGGLKRWKWGAEGATNIAAFLALIVIAQHADKDTGEARLTYDQLCAATHLSRAKLAAGLAKLTKRKLIERPVDLGRSGFRLANYDRTAPGWGKLPARALYVGGSVPAFEAFSLRSRHELNALKIYLLFVARRNIHTNLINLSYDLIEAYSGVERPWIKPALTYLAARNLVHIEHVKSMTTPDGIANAYRLVHVDSFNHLGTRGRDRDTAELIDNFGL